MFLCMRTTVDLPDELIAELKKRAADSQRSLKAVLRAVKGNLVADAYLAALASPRRRPRPAP